MKSEPDADSRSNSSATTSAAASLNRDGAAPDADFGWSVIVRSIIARVICDTGSRIFNPFLPIFALGMKMTIETLGQLIALRSITGLLAPVFGSLGDRIGFQPIMRGGLLVAGIGSLLVGTSDSLIQVAIGMVVWGIGVTAFVPSLQAYLGSQLPYEKRARGIAIVEYAWAIASIVGLFSMGWVISLLNWRAPFFVLGGGMILVSFLVAQFPSAPKQQPRQPPEPKDDQFDTQPSEVKKRKFNLFNYFYLGPNSLSAYSTMIGAMFFFCAAMQWFIAHGAWLKTEYGIGAQVLGAIAMIRGLFDLAGSGLVSLITDRIGKKLSVLLGCAGLLATFALIPSINISLIYAVVGIALVNLCFEFAIVSYIALLSEQVPETRGKVMTLGATLILIASSTAAVLGPRIYTAHGVAGLAKISLVLTLIAFVVILVFVQERSPASSSQSKDLNSN